MIAQVETITPKLAAEYLKRNTENYRNKRFRDIALYAEQMKAGRWELNGEPICFSESGKLLNGQHRLCAVIKADVPVKMLVVRDVSDEVSVFDSGITRTIPQILNANGIPAPARSNQVVGALNALIDGSFHTQKKGRRIIVDYMKDNWKDWVNVESICTTRRQKEKSLAKKASCAAACFILLKGGASEKYLRKFFGIVNSGFPDELMESSPAIVLRNMLLVKVNTNPQHRDLEFSATLSAFQDFMLGTKRTRSYVINPKHMDLLKAAGGTYLKKPLQTNDVEL